MGWCIDVVEDRPDESSTRRSCRSVRLPSTVIQGHGGHDTLRAAYSYYNVPAKTDIQLPQEDALILARSKDSDVFNALDLMENARFLKDLKFGIGRTEPGRTTCTTGGLNDVVEPSQIALVLT